MKGSYVLRGLALVLASITTLNLHAQPAGFAVAERGADYKVLQKTTVEHGSNRVHQITELATGLHYLKNGQWLESRDEIVVAPGGATAQRGPHKVNFSANLNTPAAIDLTARDGKHLRSHIVGLGFYDTASGQAVLIAELKDSFGLLYPPNHVIYTNAFTGLRADVRYTYTKAGFEQDVILREQPPAPEAYGLDPATTKLEVYTEFLNPPSPVATPVATADGAPPDEKLDFGAVKIERGKAFPVSSDPSRRVGVPTGKDWIVFEGRTFLIEQVNYQAVADNLEALPVSQASAKGPHSPPHLLASKQRIFPPSPAGAQRAEPMKLASVMPKAPGYVLDYELLEDSTNAFTFASGQTYFISGGFWVDETLTIQSNAVIKFANDPTFFGWNVFLGAGGTVNCPTSGMAVLTSVDDNGQGETITGISSGSPNLTNLTTLFLDIENNPADLHNLYFNYAGVGVYTFSQDENRFQNCSFNQSAEGIVLFSGGVILTNVFFGDVGTAVEFQTDVELDVHNLNAVRSTFQFCGELAHYVPDVGLGGVAVNLDHCCLDGLGQDLDGLGTAIVAAGGSFNWSPRWCDSDGDGLPDSWELQYFGNLNQTATNVDGNGNTLLHDYENNVNPTAISFTAHLGNQHFNTTNATGSFLVLHGVPSHEAVLVNSENFSTAVWSNYDGTVHLNLGTTDGVYQVWFGLKGYATNAEPEWIGTKVYLDRIAPTVIITSPTSSTTTTPYVQLQGCSTESLLRVTFDLSNSVVVITNRHGSLAGRYLDTNLFAYTTNYFQCYDIHLTNGGNAVTVHATDLAGNTTITNLNFTLNYAIATNPVVRLIWPQNGLLLSGTNFTVRGWVDDPTAIVTAQIINANGNTNTVYGLVERNGKLWAENLRLSSGTNWLALTVKNSAGLSSVTNITVVQSTITLTLTSTDGDLWLPTVNVNGYVSDATQAVWVNGVKATVHSDGTWLANSVPVNEGGTASFDMTAYAPDEQQPDGTYGNGGGN